MFRYRNVEYKPFVNLSKHIYIAQFNKRREGGIRAGGGGGSKTNKWVGVGTIIRYSRVVKNGFL